MYNPEEPFRVLTTGGRKWTSRKLILDAILDVLEISAPRPVSFCHGASPGGGADWIVDEVCKTHGFTVKSYPVIRSIDGPWPAAGPRRNMRMMVDFKPDFALAFPDPQSKGTWDMVSKLIKEGIKGWIVYPDGQSSSMTPEDLINARRT